MHISTSFTALRSQIVLSETGCVLLLFLLVGSFCINSTQKQASQLNMEDMAM